MRLLARTFQAVRCNPCTPGRIPSFLVRSKTKQSFFLFQSLKHSARPLPYTSPLSPRPQVAFQSSVSSYLLLIALACASALVIDHFGQTTSLAEAQIKAALLGTSRSIPFSPPGDYLDLYLPDMPVAQGTLGNLTSDQEHKLRELWAVVLRTFGVEDPEHANGTATPAESETPAASADVEVKEKKKKRISLFSRNNKDLSSGPASPKSPRQGLESDDKYGQVKEYQHIMSTESPESLRQTFWDMVKGDHPDALLLRFLRARKWDVDKALVMLISTMYWRGHEMHVDDDIVKTGEAGAVEESTSSDSSRKKEGNDFMAQLRMGKSFLHGADKQGRPLCYVRVRLHRGGEQSEKSIERYTVNVIETARLLLRPPVETATILFDMTHFSMANMDYTPVKFMIKVFEANYPESLGSVLIHKAPWIFQGIWKIIKGWLDPVVAAKVHFTDSEKDLEEFIPRSQIIKELGGDENWEYHYVEPVPGENDRMKDEATRKAIQGERLHQVLEYQHRTFEWINGGGEQVQQERNVLAKQIHDNYWKLDPFIRARTLYDRTGMIGPDGKIDFYPASRSAATKGQIQTHADDVD